ncbi:MAG: NAD(P)-dependent oxidoreductase, partial [Paenibacillus sp.]|uniref:NAD(P)-dependent oxidoreductase n=1 Tax=Paenibacillus sp. TaxID=58172 RepID=UPI0028FEEAA8
MKKIGFIGLGTMGAPMALNLLKAGYPVTVFNRTASKAAPLAEQGAAVASSPKEAAAGADVVITMVSNDESIVEVYEGTEGLLAGIRPGTTVIDCSTISPALVKRLASQIAELGGTFLDAPVTGSSPAAIDGTLVFMVGGPGETLAQVMDLFEKMNKKVL